MPNRTAQSHSLLITDLAEDLLTEATQSNEIAKLTYTLQIDLYFSYFN